MQHPVPSTNLFPFLETNEFKKNLFLMFNVFLLLQVLETQSQKNTDVQKKKKEYFDCIPVKKQ